MVLYFDFIFVCDVKSIQDVSVKYKYQNEWVICLLLTGFGDQPDSGEGNPHWLVHVQSQYR